MAAAMTPGVGLMFVWFAAPTLLDIAGALEALPELWLSHSPQADAERLRSSSPAQPLCRCGRHRAG